MKILFYLENLQSGGVQKRTMRLIDGINKNSPKDWHIILLVNFSEGEHFIDVPEGITLHVIGDLKGFKLLSYLRNYTSHHRPNVVISCMGRQFLQWLFANIFIRFSVKTIVIQAVPATLSAYSVLKNKIRTNMMRYFYPKASIVVCVSDAVRESLQFLSLKLSNKTIRIYNPVFDSAMIELAEKESNPFGKLNVINAVAVGRLNIQKDYITMIYSVKQIIQHKPNFLLHILGNGELLNELRSLVSDIEVENHIIFHGYVPNPYPYLKHADLFLMSSLWEGLPNAMVEALALGTQVVSTDCIAGPREILNDGQYGTLVPTKNINQFSKAILRELSIERCEDSLIKRGRSFSVNNSSKSYIKLCQTLVE